MKKLFLFVLILLSINIVKAEKMDITLNAGSAILIEASTGKVLYEKNMNKKMAPASMTKIMTLLLTMEALENNKIKLSDEVVISKNAASMVKEGSKIKVETLLKGISIASANDAAVAIAEYIGGTELNFVNIMNKRAKELGCKNTTFKNPHGLDEEDHLTTAYDLSLIAKELVKYPLALKLTSTYEDYIDVSGENHWLVNTNKLVRFYSGIDGLKTGYTDNALYCLTATMQRNNMRLISVVMKESSKDNRSTDTVNMMEYGFSNYGSKLLINKNDYKKTILVNNAKKRNVNYYINSDVNLIVNKDKKDVKYKIEEELFNVKAPLKKNSIIGKLKLSYDNNTYEYDLIIKEDVKKSSYFDVLQNSFRDIISGLRI